MSLSTHHLRAFFKGKMDDLVELFNQASSQNNIIFEIQKISEHLENTIQEKIRLLTSDFRDHVLVGDYSRSVTESFDDLERLLSSSKTFLDILKNKTNGELLNHIRKHYTHTLIPLLNIISKLENDYISLAAHSIQKSKEDLSKIEYQLKTLKTEEKYLKTSFLVFNKKQKLDELIQKIRFLSLRRQLLKLNIQDTRLNLYYFKYDHPEELTAMKNRAKNLRLQLSQFKEMRND